MSKATDYLNKKNSNFQLSYLELRKAVGWLGIILPIILPIGALVLRNCTMIEDSISNYYYTIMGSVLVGILCAVALFLFSYKGFDNWDWVTSNIAGVFALGVAFFPMDVCPQELGKNCNIISWDLSPLRNDIHYSSAAGLFITLACMSFFLFTKTNPDKEPTAKKKTRDKIYITCGILIIVSILLILSLKISVIYNFLSPYKPTFCFETIALWSFGFSWLVKGEFILKD